VLTHNVPIRSAPRDFVAAVLTHNVPIRSAPRDFVAAVLTHNVPIRSAPRDFVAAVLTHNGMFPCFFGGSDSRFVLSIRSDLTTKARVCDGGMTVSR